MAKVRKVYPLSAVRAMALHAQGLLQPHPADHALPTAADLEAMIERVVCVQIDTLQMVQRSQYLLLWSRLGTYDPRDLDRLTFGSLNVPMATVPAADGITSAAPKPAKKGSKATKMPANDRRTFEYWLKEACIIPLKDYRYSLPLKRWRREENRYWWQEWIAKDHNLEVVTHVRERIKDEGGLRAAEFDSPDEKRSGWWDWKPAKKALEHLYNTGEVMIANRVNFQRVYDFSERVLPDWVDTTEPTLEERHRYYLERAVRAHGLCAPLQAADYTHTRRNEVKALMQQMLAEGVFVTVQATLADGKAHPLVVHRDDLKTLNQAADGALTPARTTFLTPFDSLFWGQGRDEQLFNFEQILECYKPAPIRKWGYFCLPILHRDRVIGRFDPKLERETGTLRLKALYLEPGIQPDEEMVASVAAAMRDFMAFHHAQSVVIERSDPAEFGTILMKTL